MSPPFPKSPVHPPRNPMQAGNLLPAPNLPLKSSSLLSLLPQKEKGSNSLMFPSMPIVYATTSPLPPTSNRSLHTSKTKPSPSPSTPSSMSAPPSMPSDKCSSRTPTSSLSYPGYSPLLLSTRNH
jgi:hypothetical protein